MEALYAHVPFCRDRCSYCAFATLAEDPGLHDALIEALLDEHLRAPSHDPLTTLYLGGGTPGLLPPHRLGRLLGAFPRAADAEVSLEVNPLNVDPAALRAWAELGVTRLSLGLQTLDDGVLAELRRRHDGDDGRRALDAVAEGWSGTWSADLLVGWHGQSPARLEADLDELLRRRPPHVSVYGLTVEPGTPLEAQVAAGRPAVVGPEALATLDDQWSRRLEESGLARYEVSNFAAEGHLSRHNQVYWRNESYLGLGPGACSSIHPLRWSNLRDTRAYIDRSRAGLPLRSATERLAPSERLLESLGAGLRTRPGLARAALTRRFGAAWEPLLRDLGGDLLDAGLMILDDDGLRLPAEALVRVDRVVGELAARWGRLSEDPGGAGIGP